MALIDQESDVDTLNHLEERIHKAVALVNRLRQEKEAALKELAAVKSSLEDSEERNHRLSEEIDSLREERQQVRGRLEKLLSHIDELGSS
jgi:chromosome segregation ATPase